MQKLAVEMCVAKEEGYRIEKPRAKQKQLVKHCEARARLFLDILIQNSTAKNSVLLTH